MKTSRRAGWIRLPFSSEHFTKGRSTPHMINGGAETKTRRCCSGFFNGKYPDLAFCDISKAVTIVLASHFRAICLSELGGVGRGQKKLLQMHVHPVCACVTALLCNMLVCKMLFFAKRVCVCRHL